LLDFEKIKVGREDRVFAVSYGDVHLFLVADGAGGIAGGEEAADELVALAASYFPDRIKEISPDLLCEFLIFADEQVFKSTLSGETTAVIVVVQGSSVFGASVGDSEAWIVESSKLYELTEGQVRKPLLGSGSSVPRSLGVFKVQSGKLILGSDGLFKYAKITDIASIVGNYPSKECIPRLLNLVRFPSGGYPDDVAVIVCEVK